MQSVYLDNAATTPLTEEVIEVMYRNMTDTYGNPSSSHALGRKAKSMVEKTRKNIAKYFNCKPSQVIFTAGGSEADNLVLFNAARNLGVERFISSKIEHHAVTHCLDTLEKEDQLDVDYVRVNEFGEIDYAHLEELLSNCKKKTLVSLMLVNNEIGNILDLDKVINLCQKHKALFHSDTVQGIGHVLIDLKKTPIDFMAASAHKFHGPKGVGFCIVKNGLSIKPLLHCGEQ
jgi:cysteine desulfurase